MKSLEVNWITEGVLDAEYKKYILLAYLKHCRESFNATKLYPPISELIGHLEAARKLKVGLEELDEQFPRKVVGLDLSKGKLIREQVAQDDDSLGTIAEIISFAIPGMTEVLEEGKLAYHYAERHIELQPVGVVPVQVQEGYLMLYNDPIPDVHIYQYTSSVLATADENFRTLRVQYIGSELRSIVNTFESIKQTLLRRFSDYPNPATYVCLSHVPLPLEETFLPISKRLLMKNLASSAIPGL
ncbi:MAG: hypothetical protein JNM00_11040 [Flavobacteriales bacterium]|nr:hypothetical protein [Flavobacteriales bacterium]